MHPELVRITEVAGRFLIFDPDHIAALRRNHGICAALVGTVPQNPTQTTYMGLPLELLPEEVSVLLDKGAAEIFDGPAAHLRTLRRSDPATHRTYVDSIIRRRSLAQKHFAEERLERRTISVQLRRAAGRVLEDGNDGEGGVEAEKLPSISLAMTPTTSHELMPSILGVDVHTRRELPRPSPLYNHLHAAGYFMMPGLRFGGSYSVYPGDPFRYHAHFMATEYGWDEEVDMLDLIGSGRLGTSVKKCFLVGGEVAGPPGTAGVGSTRVFSVEWAGM